MTDHAYVAYLDILGYKELLEADVRAGSQNFKDRMIQAFRAFEAVNRSRYAYRAISDSIFISCTERSAAHEFLCILREVYVSFLDEGLLIRGGISFGQHFENQSITYSPVLTKAHALESAVAEFPRIMIDSNILDMFPDLKRDGIALRSGKFWFLNVVTTESFEKTWGAAKSTCTSNRLVIDCNERARMKHRWLQEFLLEMADKLQIIRPEPYLGIFDHYTQHTDPSTLDKTPGQICLVCLGGVMVDAPDMYGSTCSKCGAYAPGI